MTSVSESTCSLLYMKLCDKQWTIHLLQYTQPSVGMLLGLGLNRV